MRVRAISKSLRVPTDSTSVDGVAPFGHACPRCGAPMVMLNARSGPHAAQPIWSCSTYPKCRGTIAIAIAEGPFEPADGLVPSAAGRAELDGWSWRPADWIRRRWPAVVLALATMLVAYLLVQTYFGSAWGSFAAFFMALAFIGAHLKGPTARR